MGILDGYKTYDTSRGFGNRRMWQKAFNSRMTGEEAEAILGTQEQSPWDILEIPNDSSQEVIKAAFRRLIAKWHPDRNPQNVEMATEVSQMLIAAYTKLKTN